MRLAIWIISAILAVVSLLIGGSKLITPTAEMESMAEGVPVVLLRIAGVAEVLGALGLVLPAATRILPLLTPIAATGLAVTWIGATITNAVIGQYATIALTLTLVVLALFVAWARFGRYAIARRTAPVQTATS